MIFGVISEKTRIEKVTASVPAPRAHSLSPNSSMAMTLTRVAAAELTEFVAEQDDAEHLVRLGEEIERLARPGVAGLGHVAQAEAIAGHHGRLAEREEG